MDWFVFQPQPTTIPAYHGMSMAHATTTSMLSVGFAARRDMRLYIT